MDWLLALDLQGASRVGYCHECPSKRQDVLEDKLHIS